jgi:catechol 2,3-dioxygenase-like lactoylglutathione lyase family enzyme
MKLVMDHVGIRVKDFERFKAFYKKYFGFEQFDSYDNPPPVGKELHLKSGDVHLELFLADRSAKEPELDMIGKKDRGVCHLCFNVDHIEDIYNRMKADGVIITAELGKGTFDSGKWCKYFFFKDPEDTIVEVLEGYYS